MTKTKAQQEMEQQALVSTSTLQSASTDEQLRKIAQSTTVTIQNINLELGQKPKDVVKFIKERLLYYGERGEMTIVDISLEPNGVQNSVSL